MEFSIGTLEASGGHTGHRERGTPERILHPAHAAHLGPILHLPRDATRTTGGDYKVTLRAQCLERDLIQSWTDNR